MDVYTESVAPPLTWSPFWAYTLFPAAVLPQTLYSTSLVLKSVDCLSSCRHPAQCWLQPLIRLKAVKEWDMPLVPYSFFRCQLSSII